MEIKQGKMVRFNTGIVSGKGMICGIATIGDVVIGRSIILEIVEINTNLEDYPYTHACFFECQLKDI